MSARTIALLQMTAGIDPQENARVVADAAAEAAGRGASILFMPEMTNLIDRDRVRAAERIVDEAEDVVVASARSAARTHALAIALGSVAVREPGAERLRNRSLFIDEAGEVRARYDKLHLFDVALGQGDDWRESTAYAPGEAHWATLLKARAVENACFVVAAAQTGKHEDGRRTWGRSTVISPWGEVLLDMDEEPGVGVVAIDEAQVADARGRIDVLTHRRAIPTVTVS